jgi:hypothetical protein
MKKFFILSVSLMTISAVTFAQTTFGIRAGIQSTAHRLDIEEGDAEANLDGTRTGFVIGGTADIKLGTNWSFQPQLNFFMKNGSLLAFGEGKINQMTIDVPLNILYRHNGFFAGLGPNLSYGLSAKLKSFDDTDPDQDLYEEEGGNEAPLKRFEFGINSTLGYEFPGGFVLSVNFTPGMTDILNEEQEGYKLMTRTFGLNFGYIFNKGAAKKK